MNRQPTVPTPDRRLREISPHSSLNQLQLSESGEPFFLSHASRTNPGDARTWKRANFPFTCFEYVVSGSGRVGIGELCFDAAADEVYILPCGRDHVISATPGDTWGKQFAVIHGELPERLLELYGLGGQFHFRDCRNSGIRELLEKLAALDNTKPPELHQLAAGIVTELIARLAYLRRPAPPPLRTLEIKFYLDRHLYEPLYLPELAEHFQISERQLIRSFRHDMGVTPYAYYLARKLELATQLLSDPRLTIAKVAAQLHFSDAYHFSKLFRAKLGCSPRQFRRHES